MFKRVVLVVVTVALLLSACGAPAAEPSIGSQGEAAGAQPDARPEGVSSTAYVIVPAESEARFVINEVLAGEANTVVGVTSSVQGAIDLDLAQVDMVEVGQIVVDVTNLTTDDNRRNRAIRNFILQTSRPENQAAVFEIVAIDGLPSAADSGTTYQLTLTGALTIHGVTQTETFEGEVTVETADRLRGSFSSTIQYADYGMAIPDVPLVASVDDDLALALDFVAAR